MAFGTLAPAQPEGGQWQASPVFGSNTGRLRIFWYGVGTLTVAGNREKSGVVSGGGGGIGSLSGLKVNTDHALTCPGWSSLSMAHTRQVPEPGPPKLIVNVGSLTRAMKVGRLQPR